MNILEVRNIVKDYDKHRALNNVSLAVKEASTFGLLGPNGAGKTTLIRIINQITAPDSGELFFMDRPAQASDVQYLGYLPEERGLYKKMKVGEQAIYLSRLKGMSKNDCLKNLKYWFEKFEIESWWNKRIEELSKGMAQKVQFITTVVHQPKLLIFDEPFSGFDPINTELIKNEILALKDQGTTIIFSAHDMGSVEEVCDHVALINKSEKIIDGNIHDIKEQYKKGIFEIELSPNDLIPAFFASNKLEILHSKERYKKQVVRFRKTDNMSNRETIERLNTAFNVFSFKEIIPSMKEVFLTAVEQSNTNV